MLVENIALIYGFHKKKIIKEIGRLFLQSDETTLL